MLTVRTSENTVITSFRLISERQDFSSVRTGENTVRARARIQLQIEATRASTTFSGYSILKLITSAASPLRKKASSSSLKDINQALAIRHSLTAD